MSRKPNNPKSSSPRLIVGLGNPGSTYAQTRHNAGFLALESIAELCLARFRRPLFRRYLIADGVSPAGREFRLLKPLTYMNRSGVVVPSVRRPLGIDVEEIIVVCDQLDLPVGMVRIKRGGGTGGHRGLRSLVEELGSDRFIRVYVGIDKPAGREAVVNHVLGVPSQEEAPLFERGIATARDAVIRIIDASIEEAMNEYNRRGVGTP